MRCSSSGGPRRFASEFELSNVSYANGIVGSHVRSQPGPMPSYVQRWTAVIHAAQRRIKHHHATPAEPMVLLWEQEAAGSNPAIRHGHPDQVRAHVDLGLVNNGSHLGSPRATAPCVADTNAWPTPRGARTARTRSISSMYLAAVTRSTTAAARGGGVARSPGDSVQSRLTARRIGSLDACLPETAALQTAPIGCQLRISGTHGSLRAITLVGETTFNQGAGAGSGPFLAPSVAHRWGGSDSSVSRSSAVSIPLRHTDLEMILVTSALPR